MAHFSIGGRTPHDRDDLRGGGAPLRLLQGNRRGTQDPHGRCPVCGGKGTAKVTPPAVICAYCKGRGEVPVRSGLTCPVCRGKGVVSVKEPIETCPACKGRGAAGGGNLPCTRCQGKGVVIAHR